MKRAFPVFRLLLLPVMLLCSFISCSSSSGIDDFYTFNVMKTQSLPITPQVSVEQDITIPFQMPIDSADLITSSTLSTNLSLIKSVKLTKLAFSSSDQSYPMASFDTLRLFVSADSLADELLAAYSGSADSVFLTNADFANYLKKPSVHYSVTFRANKAPAQSTTFTATTNLVFSAAPIQ